MHQFLKNKRIERGVSQQALAKKLGYCAQYVSNWERGLVLPPLGHGRKICNMLGITYREFKQHYMAGNPWPLEPKQRRNQGTPPHRTPSLHNFHLLPRTKYGLLNIEAAKKKLSSYTLESPCLKIKSKKKSPCSNVPPRGIAAWLSPGPLALEQKSQHKASPGVKNLDVNPLNRLRKITQHDI